LFLLVSACDINDQTNDYDDTSDVNNIVSISNTTDHYFPFKPGSTIRNAVRIDDSLFISGRYGNEPLLGIAHFEISEDNDINISSTTMIDIEAPKDIVYGIAAGGDGYFYVLRSVVSDDLFTNINYSNDVNSDSYYLIQKYSTNGELIDQMTFDIEGEDIIFGIAIGSNGEIAIYGATHVSLLQWGGEIVNSEKFNGNSYILTVVNNIKGFIISVYDTHSRITRYYTADNDTGAFSEIKSASKNDTGITFESIWSWDRSENDTNSSDQPSYENILQQVSFSEDGFNHLGITTKTQGFADEYIVDNGFRFFTLCLETGVYENLFRWNFNNNDVASCLFVIRFSESILMYALNNSEYIVLRNTGT